MAVMRKRDPRRIGSWGLLSRTGEAAPAGMKEGRKAEEGSFTKGSSRLGSAGAILVAPHRRMPGGVMNPRRMLLRLDLGARVHRVVLALVVSLLVTPAAAQTAPRPRPEGVTDSTIAWGRQLFHGSANCASCHGFEARGTDEGPALSGALWLHGPGTYEWLVEQIKQG